MSLITKISGALITRLGESSSASSSSATSTLSGKGVGASFDKGAVDLTLALQNASAIFANSFTRMNQALSVFQVAKDSLGKLLKLTDEMLELADQASEITLSDVDRNRINSRYQKKKKEFNATIDAAYIEGVDLLDKNDLKEILQNSGIDLSAASELAQTFAKIAGSDGNLGYEKFKSEDARFSYIRPTTTGDGTFKAGVAFWVAAGQTPELASGDLNRDGYQDIVGMRDGYYSVALGDGDGHFTPATEYATSISWTDPVLVDVNGDWILDLAGIDATGASSYVMLGNGDGTFNSANSWYMGSDPEDLAFADLNGDGMTDMISSYVTDPADFVSSTAEATDITLQGAVKENTSLDFNTGDADIWAGGLNPEDQKYFTLSSPTTTYTFWFRWDVHASEPEQPNRVEIDCTSAGTWEDIQNAIVLAIDGHADFSAAADENLIVVTNAEGGAAADATEGNISSGFTAEILADGADTTIANGSYLTIDSPGTAYYVWYDIDNTGSDPLVPDKTAIEVDISATDDADAVAAATAAALDALLDFSASSSGGTVSVTNLTGGPATDATSGTVAGASVSVVTDGSFGLDTGTEIITVEHYFETGDRVQITTTGTLPGGLSALTDYYVIKVDSNHLKLAANYADAISGTAVDLTDIGSGTHTIIDPDDTDGDSGIAVRLGSGDGSFGERTIAVKNAPNSNFVTADLNGDGKLDLAFGGEQLGTAFNNGDGTFAAPSSLNNADVNFVAAGDMNGDGKTDLISLSSDTNLLTVSLGDGEGSFTTAATYTLSSTPSFVGVADLNGDEDLDIVAAHGGTRVSLFMGDGDGSFGAPSTIFTSTTATNPPLLADISNDSVEDIVYAQTGLPVYGITRIANTQVVSRTLSDIGRASSSSDPLVQDLRTIGGAMVAKESLAKLRDLIANDAEGIDKIVEGLGVAAQFALSGVKSFDNLVGQANLIGDPAQLAQKVMQQIKQSTSGTLLQLHSGLDTELAKDLLAD